MSEAHFTTGSTMRHVAVMTGTGAVGLMALFLVDAVNLFYISLLGREELAAAIGFAGTFQFFLISISIGLAIAAGAVVSRTLGAGDDAGARQAAGSALFVLVSALTLAGIAAFVFRHEGLAALGAEGRTLELAARFLAIVIPALPLLGIGMVTSGLLRAAGDGRRAMNVTLGGGIIAAVLDPILIFGLDLGLDGAALSSVAARFGIAFIGLAFVTRVHDLLGLPGPARFLSDAKQLLAIAGPAVATQLSTPFGNAYLTRVVAEHGDEAVAGWAVVGRLAAVAFGGLFALSGAIGPILGQNRGAGLPDRIRMAYRDALIFTAGYVLVVWLALWSLTPFILSGFDVGGGGVEVVRAFTSFGAGAWLFSGWLFVSNAACNNLGRPLWATGFNWSRDAAAIPLLALLITGGLGLGMVASPADAVAVQALAAVLMGTTAAVVTGRLLLPRLGDAVAQPAPAGPELPPFTSGRAAPIYPSGGASRPKAEGEREGEAGTLAKTAPPG
ncbi:MAG: MATE family efflux transporter [Pseudomonadota bacterium]